MPPQEAKICELTLKLLYLIFAELLVVNSSSKNVSELTYLGLSVREEDASVVCHRSQQRRCSASVQALTRTHQQIEPVSEQHVNG